MRRVRDKGIGGGSMVHRLTSTWGFIDWRRRMTAVLGTTIGGFNQRQGEAFPPNIFDFVPICPYCSNAQNGVRIFSAILSQLLPPDVRF